jgi:plastocyanin
VNSRTLFAPLLAAALAASVVVRAPAAASGAIAGVVEVPDSLRAPARRPRVADLGMPEPRDVPDWRHSVLYLETAPRGAFEERETRVRMDQRHEAFVPHILAITVGTTVDFPNNDATFHNVFSLSRTRSFDLGRYAAGHSKSVRFDRPGIVRVFCDIHSHMSAFILVFSHRFFAVTDDAGRYRIEDVPPGSYTVVVWNERLPQASKPVTIPAAGGTVTLDFSLKESRP